MSYNKNTPGRIKRSIQQSDRHCPTSRQSMAMSILWPKISIVWQATRTYQKISSKLCHSGTVLFSYDFVKTMKNFWIFFFSKTELKPSIKQAGIEAAHVSFVSTSHKEPHNCPYCPMEYAHRTKLLKHCKEKHKDQPVPYKYKKWKARDLVEREVNQKARDIEKLIVGG